MKLTAKQLREIIDTLPNPREARTHERKIAIIPGLSDIKVTHSPYPRYTEEEDEIKFILNAYQDEWELEINPDRELVKSLRSQISEFKDVKNQLVQLKHDHKIIQNDLYLSKMRYEHLRSKWWNRLYYKVKFQFTMIKYRIKYALH